VVSFREQEFITIRPEPRAKCGRTVKVAEPITMNMQRAYVSYEFRHKNNLYRFSISILKNTIEH
jgi:hypothetical protein